MEWIGFTKQIDEETGKVTWKLKDGIQRIHLIAGALGLIVGLKLIKGIKGLITGSSRLGQLLGTGGLYTTLKKLLEPIKILGAKDGLKYIFMTAKESRGKFLPVAGKVAGVLGGIVGVILGSSGVYNAFKQLRKEGELGKDELLKYNVALLEVVGGASAIGFVLGGPMGALIGALTGVVIAGASAWKGYDDALTEMAEKDLFGSIHISTEEWTEIIKNSAPEVENLSTKLDTLNEKLKTHADAFSQSQDALDLYGIKYGQLGQEISEEDAPKILDAIKTMGDESTKIIDESTDFTLSIWGKTFGEMDTISEDEEKDILNSIVNYSSKQKAEIKTAQDNISTTYQNAINTRGYLTDQEYTYIQEQLAKIRTLTESEMTKNQSNIEYYKKLFADKNGKLDKESYNNFNKALKGYEDEQLGIIEENYNIRLKSAQELYDKGAIGEEKYNKMTKTAYNERKKETENLRKNLDGIQDGVYKDLAKKYEKIEKKTDDTSKRQKKIIEGVFKNINIDDSEMIKKFADIGTRAGSMCMTNIERELNKGTIRIDVDVKSKGKSEFGTLKFSSRGYATGGLPPVGQLFVANEKGPELVGQIGGQSFVANQNQMIELLDRKIGNAQNNSRPQIYNIYLDESHKIGTYTLEQLQGMAKTNGKPITIGY